jgi:polysaccharide export outer membrane protein
MESCTQMRSKISCFRAGSFICVLLAFGGLSACASPPVSHVVTGPPAATAPSAVTSTEAQSLPPEQQVLPSADIDQPYVLGPSDVVSVMIYSHPELSAPQPGLTGGVMINNDGTIEMPLVGSVKLGGLTVQQAQQALTTAYAGYVDAPNITVQLISEQNLRYYLLGAFASTGLKFPGRELQLLQALSLGGSVDLANADLYQAYVVQNSQKLPIDFRSLLVNGDLTQNIVLQPGDTVVIPSAASEDAFVFGSVGKPGPVVFEAGALSLLQALSAADLDLANYTNAQLSEVRVIRSHGATADFIVVDANKILNGQALPFALEPGDVVFVPPTGVATWNQVLSDLIPSLQTISGVLNPFVSIAYLSRRNN